MISGYYTATPNSGIRPLEVQFSGVSNVYDEALYKYNFGDGSSEEYGQVVTHEYTGPTGNYYPTVTIIPNSGDIRGQSWLESYVLDNTYDNILDYWTYNSESGNLFIECSSESDKIIYTGHTVSGDFLYEAKLSINTDIEDNASGIGIIASGDSSYVSMLWHGDTCRLWSEYSGETLSTISNISGEGKWLPLWIQISKTSGTYYSVDEDSYSGHSSNLWGGQEYQNDVITNRWITYKLETVNSGVLIGSDVENSGDIANYISCYSGYYDTYGNSNTFKNIHFNFPCDSLYYVDNIKIYQNDSLLYDTDFNNTLNGFNWITDSSGIITKGPIDSSNKCLKIYSQDSNAILNRDINVNKSSAPIYVYTTILYPSGEYNYNDKSWSENNSFYIDIFPHEGTGYRAKYSPNNFISYSTTKNDYNLWSLNTTNHSGEIKWKYRVEDSGEYQTLTSSGVLLDDTLQLGLYNGHSSTHDNHRLHIIRSQAESDLPNSGVNPLGSQDSWINEDFNTYDHSLYNSSGFYPDSGIFYNLTESGIRCDYLKPTSSGPDTWRHYSSNFSGNFQLDTLVYSEDTEDQGIIVVDSENTDNYIKFIYGSEGLSVNYIYDSPNESGFNIPNTSNLHPFHWWSRVKKINNNNGNSNMYVYWASGEQYPTEWNLCSSGDYSANWGNSDSNYSGAYSSFEIPDTSGMFLKEVRLHSDDRVSPMYESGILINSSITNFSGIVDAVGKIYSNIYYDPHTAIPDMGSKLKKFVPVLINQRVTPYRASSDDKLQSKVKIYRRGKLYQKSGIPIELWLNHESEWSLAASGTTNRYGIATIYYNCSNIDNIDCCLGYAKITINGNIYKSNTTRYNFINLIESPQGEVLIIDAGSGDADRSEYDTFTSASGGLDRSSYHLIDRMFGE